MVKVLFQAPIAGLRGTIGGVTYSENQGGPYAKIWSKGSNPRTAKQTEQRSRLSNFAQNWQNLTSAQRADWDTYAALAAQDKIDSLGETFSISGFAWYVALSNNLVRANRTAIDSAPVLGTPATPVIESASLNDDSSGTSSQVKMTAGSPQLSSDHIVTGNVVNTLARTTTTINRKWLTTEVPNVNRVANFQGEINEKFGTIQLEQFAFYEVQIQNLEGRQGSVASISVQATA